MKRLALAATTIALLAVPAVANAAVYQWPTPSASGTMVAGTNSTAPSCARADAVIDS